MTPTYPDESIQPFGMTTTGGQYQISSELVKLFKQYLKTSFEKFLALKVDNT